MPKNVELICELKDLANSILADVVTRALKGQMTYVLLYEPSFKKRIDPFLGLFRGCTLVCEVLDQEISRRDVVWTYELEWEVGRVARSQTASPAGIPAAVAHLARFDHVQHHRSTSYRHVSEDPPTMRLPRQLVLIPAINGQPAVHGPRIIGERRDPPLNRVSYFDCIYGLEREEREALRRAQYHFKHHGPVFGDDEWVRTRGKIEARVSALSEKLRANDSQRSFKVSARRQLKYALAEEALK